MINLIDYKKKQESVDRLLIIKLIIESKLNNWPTLVWTCHKRRLFFWKCYVENAWLFFLKKSKNEGKFGRNVITFQLQPKSLSQLPTLLLLRGNFEQISKNCGDHILNLLWDAHQCPKKKIEEEKKTLAIRGRATHGEPLVWNRCCAVLDFERTLWFQFKL